ncbi:Hypothetical protein NTJ_11194 [Nesidiocoris tenuis]|uniref:Uncharacterized protein n=1 Tax=Nesidiocoris tenuis TaxID=355587 RepID=A0ABN7B1T3_9HEMI|nr:Hypothetical protein NTJ_11194 [Nesidiocoris tenuis]
MLARSTTKDALTMGQKKSTYSTPRASGSKDPRPRHVLLCLELLEDVKGQEQMPQCKQDLLNWPYSARELRECPEQLEPWL